MHKIKKIYEKGTQEILRMHRTGAGGIRVALALTHQRDTLLQMIFKHLLSNANHLTVVALGGYGRKELCFSSDTDVMFLISDEQQRAAVTPAVQEFIHNLLDVGLTIGHSFRTIDECITLPPEDFESRMSLIEARFICGDRTIFRKLISSIQEKIKKDDRHSFVHRISDSRRMRHNKYGSSAKLLEPNIKNSAGGLRDIHAALWLMRGTGTIPIPKNLGASETATLHLLTSQAVKLQFTPSALKELKSSFDTLLRVRNEMHIQSNALHDTLEFSFQQRIASGLHYRTKSKRAKVEHFMQDYYRASRSVALFCTQVIDWSHDRWSPVVLETKTAKLSGTLSIRNGRIHLSKRGVTISNELLLRAFLFRSERHAKFSFQLEDAIHRRLQFLKPLCTPSETELFRLLLHRPNGIGSALRTMNELGLLERWIPEWKPMVSFFQHNQYHYYTADEHTIIALANAEALEHSSSSFGTVFRSLPRRDTLYLACLLHDIAKPSHIGKHEIKGVFIAKRVLQRLLYDDLIEDVSFLIRHHLLMEQVAFRRNLNDTQTIVDFARTFDRIEQLDYLYVLTYADLSAVNKNVWTEWKELLLRDLYRKARIVLEKEMTSEEIRKRTAQLVEEKHTDIIHNLAAAFPADEVNAHISQFSDTSYIAAFKPDEIANHLQAIRQTEKISVLFQQSNSFTDVTFIAQDSPGVLSKFCGVLTANDANILNAEVFTRRDGIVIDKFRVVEFGSNAALSEDHCLRISRDVTEVMEGRIEIARLIERHRMRWKRRTRIVNPNTRCDVEFEDHPQFTIIDVYAPDMLGLLYRITETISRLGLNISFAKIATRVDGIVDSFYLLDTGGKKLDDPVQQEVAKREILATIQTLSESGPIA
ncbi:MAG: [protein-PII] uridylyltransferase [Bacteroidota bacterium]